MCIYITYIYIYITYLELNVGVSDRTFNTREIKTWILSLSATLGMSTSSQLLISPGSCVDQRDVVGTHTLSFEF